MMFPSIVRSLRLLPVAIGLAMALPQANAQRRIEGHVPQAVSTLAAKGNLPAETQLQLAIGLPVRDAAGLEAFVRSVSDPASSNYRQYLTTAQFAERFGPTEEDYQRIL